MRYRTLALILAFFVGSSALAFAADAPKPLRTLVYDVQYDWWTTRVERTSGFSANGNAISEGSGQAKTDMQDSDNGKLTVDVIAATPDYGLVVDAAFAGHKNPQSVLRVAIFPDGRLSFDPSKKLSPEATALLPMLARLLIANRDLSVGGSWSVPATAPATGDATFKVLDMTGTLAKFSIASTLTTTGANGFSQQSDATMTYDTAKSDPIDYDLSVRVRRQVSADIDENDKSHLVAKLASDSFAK